MPRLSISEFWRDERAAIAPLYALSMFGLIVVAGVGWDYGRLMGMDSELQNAADQAALAAVTQLDGREGAMERARDAATGALATADSDWVNITVMANDGDGREITDLSFRFFESYDSATDTLGPEVTNDDDAEDAEVVMVTVNGREAFYALTAIVDAFSSGDIEAVALAGLQSATCNVPPLMFCAPTGSDDFPTDTDIGKALKMHMRANEADVWAPGNFGFLDIEYSDTPNGNPNTTLGWNSDFLGCAGEAVESRTGFRVPETRALNTRFDRYDNSAPNCDTSSGDFCPAQNVRRDWVRVEQRGPMSSAALDLETCDGTDSGTWTQIEDLPTTVANQALPPDNCFLSSTCASFGDGTWDSTTYMSEHHGSTTLSSVPDLDGNGTVTRYEVYDWEKAASSRTDPKEVGRGPKIQQGNSSNYRQDLYCSYSRPVVGTPVVPTSTQKDRRLLTVASVDCAGLSGHGQVDIIRWVDMFLFSTVDENESDRSFYAEIKGVAQTAAGNAGFQHFGRNKPVLLR